MSCTTMKCSSSLDITLVRLSLVGLNKVIRWQLLDGRNPWEICIEALWALKYLGTHCTHFSGLNQKI
jgi:hypothetical protein